MLAWTCCDAWPDRGLRVAALRDAGAHTVWHAFATWNELAFDASGWHPITDLVAANEAFEGRRLELVDIDLDLAEFCAAHRHRMPQDYWADPVPRAEAYLGRFVPPWQV